MPCAKRHCPKNHCTKCPRSEQGHVHDRNSYCTNHQCPAGNTPCTTPKNKEARYCDQHACQNETCDKLARPGRQVYCPAHECSAEGCHNERESMHSHCGSHIPRCQMSNCPRTDLEGTKYCPTHRCQKNGCDNPTIPKKRECQFHVACEEGGCTRPRAEKAEGGWENHCYLHVWRKCRECKTLIQGNDVHCVVHACGIRGCGEPSLTGRNAGSQFCLRHTCQAQTGCDAPVHRVRDLHSQYCRQHECTAPNCHNEAKTPAGGFCDALHACHEGGCGKPRTQSRNSHYCESHECKDRGCVRKARKEGGYCAESHACAVPDCPAKSPSDAKYCSNHACKRSGCRGLSKGASGGGYCEEFGHACVEENCNDKRLSESKSPFKLCVSHTLRKKDEEVKKKDEEIRALQGGAKPMPAAEPTAADGDGADSHDKPLHQEEKQQPAAVPATAPLGGPIRAPTGGSTADDILLMVVPRQSSFLRKLLDSVRREDRSSPSPKQSSTPFSMPFRSMSFGPFEWKKDRAAKRE